jgi:hypothetical protein
MIVVWCRYLRMISSVEDVSVYTGAVTRPGAGHEESSWHAVIWNESPSNAFATFGKKH